MTARVAGHVRWGDVATRITDGSLLGLRESQLRNIWKGALASGHVEAVKPVKLDQPVKSVVKSGAPVSKPAKSAVKSGAPVASLHKSTFAEICNNADLCTICVDHYRDAGDDDEFDRLRGLQRNALGTPVMSAERDKTAIGMIESGDVELHFHNGRNLLHILMLTGCCDTAVSFLRAVEDADVRIRMLIHLDHTGKTPLHWALLRGGGNEFLEQLIDLCPTSVWAVTDRSGQTPLHIAVSLGNADSAT